MEILQIICPSKDLSGTRYRDKLKASSPSRKSKSCHICVHCASDPPIQLYYVDPVIHIAAVMVMVMMVVTVVLLVVLVLVVVMMDHRSSPSLMVMMMVVIYDSMLPTFCTIAQFQAPRRLSVSSSGHIKFLIQPPFCTSANFQALHFKSVFAFKR